MKRRMLVWITLITCAIGSFLVPATSQEKKDQLSNGEPRTAREEQMTFQILKGLRIELAACEPEVVDPVAMAFDEQGRLFVAEMHGYPNEGVATGDISSGKVKLLEDRDGDGFFEHSSVYADGLRFPTSVMPFKGGLLVANAPDILYFQDTTGDGKADKKRVLYTGFDVANIQQLVNSFQWGLDNWVYGMVGGNGGNIRSAEKPKAAAVTLRGRGIRFHPDVPASLEPTSGSGQYGLAADTWGRWFTATNSQHLRMIVLPDHYLRRNSLLPVRTTTINIPDHGAACKVHRISDFEAWRVERTGRRKSGPDSKRFSPTELVPGGFITSACSPLVYLADLLPKEYQGNVFVCDPANNLIHRDKLELNGVTYVAKRADENCEFMASTDNFFRPVHMILGPDGAIYVADFYREVIETPRSLPDDIKKRVNLQSRKRGRIWRIIPDGKHKVVTPSLLKSKSKDLVANLAHPNFWWRTTSQRLLVERQDKSAIEPLQKLVRSTKSPAGRMHALWTLDGLNALTEADVVVGLKDAEAGVREQSLKMAEQFLAKSKTVRDAVAALANDPSARVRFQLAFSMGEADTKETASALAAVARKDLSDSWIQTAVLSSAHSKMAPSLLKAMVEDGQFTKGSSAHLQFLTKLAALVSGSGKKDDLSRALKLLAVDLKKGPQKWHMAMLEGIGQGLKRSKRSLSHFLSNPPADLKNAVQAAIPLFKKAGDTAKDTKSSIDDRLMAIRLLGYGPFQPASDALEALLGPQYPTQIQLAAVTSLSTHSDDKVSDIFLNHWKEYSPEVRREVVNALFAEKGRLQQLLNSIKKKQIPLSQLEPARIDLLKKYPDAKIRQQAMSLVNNVVVPARKAVLEKYMPALDLKPSAAQGKMLFKKNCSTCHRLENIGFETGPDLVAVLGGKSPEDILTSMLDPNREVDPRYLEYVVITKAGRILTGRIAAETASSITLRRAQSAEDIVLRSEIDTIQATSKSLMPEGLEKQLSQQNVADLIAYLQSAAKKK